MMAPKPVSILKGVVEEKLEDEPTLEWDWENVPVNRIETNDPEVLGFGAIGTPSSLAAVTSLNKELSLDEFMVALLQEISVHTVEDVAKETLDAKNLEFHSARFDQRYAFAFDPMTSMVTLGSNFDLPYRYHLESSFSGWILKGFVAPNHSCPAKAVYLRTNFVISANINCTNHEQMSRDQAALRVIEEWLHKVNETNERRQCDQVASILQLHISRCREVATARIQQNAPSRQDLQDGLERLVMQQRQHKEENVWQSEYLNQIRLLVQDLKI
jgi:hypothetical protein